MLVELIAPLLSGMLLTPTTGHIVEKTAHETTRADIACNCMAFARQYRPDLPDVNASDLIPNSDVPVVGGGVLFFYPHSGLSHIGIVENIEGDHITVIESNFKPCNITRRVIPVDERRVVGFYVP